MKLAEVLNSRLDLEWQKDANEHFANFEIEDRKYGISAIEEIDGEFKFLRVDFHYSDDEGKLHHEATGFNKDAGKVLGVVCNGIKDKFRGHVQGIYFVAKREFSVSEEEYQARCKLYQRMCQKLSVELNMQRDREQFESGIFALAENNAAMKKFREFLN